MKSLLFISLSLLTNSVLFSQIPTFEYTHTSPTIDGVSEPLWNDIQEEIIAINNEGTISSTTDLNGSFKFIWDSTYLYLFVLVNDDINNSDNQNSEWQDDGIEVYLDMLNEKANTYDDNDFLFAFRYQDNTIHLSSGPSKAGVIFSQLKTGTTITYEVRFPWSTLGVTPSENMEFGLDIHLNDNDDTGDREGKLAWFTDEDNSWRYPSLFGTAKLGTVPPLVTLPKSYAPTYSKERGFYSSPFDLTISSTETGATITYTLDGSDPRTSATALTGSSPLTLTIDPTSSTNRGGLTPGVLVRSTATETGYSFSDVETHSYIFIEEVKTQSDPDGIWPNPYEGGWGFNGRQNIDYDMDQDVVTAPAYQSLITDALLQIPTISLVTDNDHIFDDNTGIYMNALEQGWERPVSIELLNPDQSEGFQVEGGLRVRGGYSRIPSNPKHSFRLFFRKEYGDSKLKYPLFDNEGTDEFDKVDLRTAQNYSWSNNDSDQNTFLKDVSFRDIQGAMNHPHSRSKYYHLYVDGMYWGLFMTEERQEARFAESYLGGDNSDYDVIKPERDIENYDNDLRISTTDGTDAAAKRLWAKVVAGFNATDDYYQIQGMNNDGTRNSAFERLLDIENLIDYLQIAYYAGGYDAPLSAWSSDPLRPNNFSAIYNRNNPDGFKWMVHDFEHTMNTQSDHSMNGALEEDWLINRTLPEFSDNFDFFNPVRIHLELMNVEEYKMKFADRAHKNFTTGGYLFPDSVQKIFDTRQAQFDLAIIAESARWGDTRSTPARTKVDWLDYINVLRNDYIPYRTDIVIQQFKDEDWYPSINAPEFQQSGTNLYGQYITSLLGEQIVINNTNGTTGDIYYTIDGSDPRANGGTVNTTASLGNDNISVSINSSLILKARILSAGEWSPLKEILVTVDDPLTDLKITEVHYNPIDENGIDGGNYEFIELKNTGNKPINLTGASLTNGIAYTFETTLLAPGEFIVLAASTSLFNDKYGFMPDGQFIGGLKNSGEKITLSNAFGAEVISFSYSDQSSWPVAADGLGNSLVANTSNPTGNPNSYSYWRASSYIGGSPGADDPVVLQPNIVISEVLSHTDAPLRDAIELQNLSNNEIDISNWFLTDDKGNLTKWQIPSGTTIPSNGFITFYEGHYVDTSLAYATNEFGNAFSISSHGEAVYLVSADADSNLTGFSTGVSFEEIETNKSFGRYVNSEGHIHFVAQTEVTLNSANATPEVGPIIFNEIMYNPIAGQYEYLKLTNISTDIVSFNADDTPLNTWKIEGAGFTFPSNISLAPNTSLYVIQTNTDVSTFRTANGFESNVQVFNMTGVLSNDGETLSLKKPGDEYIDGIERTFAYILIDEVTYNDKDPWTTDADSNGYSLVRISETEYGNDVINWNNGINTPPTLIEDNSENNILNDITISFVDDAKWRSNIISIEVNGIIISSSKYTIQANSIDITSDQFTTEDIYTIDIFATDYYTTSIEQFVAGDPLSNSLNSSRNHFQITPNPSNGIFYIEINNNESNHYEVINMFGQLIEKGNVRESSFNIDLGIYKSGIYLLLLKNENGFNTHKLIKE